MSPTCTAVLEINFHTLKEYWDVRDRCAATIEDTQRLDNLVIGMLSTRVSIEDWRTVLELAERQLLKGHHAKALSAIV